MSLRLRIALFVAGLAAVAVAGVATAAYVSAANEVYGEVDEFLEQRLVTLSGLALGDVNEPVLLPQDPFMMMDRRQTRFIQPDTVVQILTSDGRPFIASAELPVADIDIEISRGDRPATLHTVEMGGEQYRIITAPFTFGNQPIGAIQLGRSLTEAISVLDGMKARMVTMGLIGVLLAGLAGWLVAGRALRPVGQLTAAAEHVASTQDLESPIRVDQDDEVGRLANSFNSMLAALADSKRQQQQLVADAGHELRTPLTSLRTNIELLARAGTLPEQQRRELMADATSELEQLSDLVTELVDLATDRSVEEPLTEVRLDEVVASVAERAERRWGRVVSVRSEPSVLTARRSGIQRAISNLVENAVKWGPNGEPIEVVQAGGRVTVRDHGPGIPAEDLDHVFDRFYRATTARSMPGSGLGLAIVRKVIEEHDGTVFAANAPDGGAVVGFELPETDEAGS